MSSGITHMKASLLLSGGFIVSGIILHDNHSIEYGIGSLAGILLSPDLDVDGGFIGDKLIRGKIGLAVEKIWDITWHMYRKSLKHGGPLSHFPVIGTIGRLAYLYFIIIVIPHTTVDVTLQMSWDLGYVLHWYFIMIMSMWRIILGLMGSDFIHWGLDILTTEHSGRKHVHGILAKLKRLMY